MELHLICKRCGYRWTRRAQGRLPKQCSRCKNFHWNEDVVRGRGRPKKVVEERTGDPVHVTEVAQYSDAEIREALEERGPVSDEIVGGIVVERVEEIQKPAMPFHGVFPIKEITKKQFVELWPEAKSGHGESCSCTNCLLERGVL